VPEEIGGKGDSLKLGLSRRRGEPQIFLGAAVAILTLGIATWWGTDRIVDERRVEIGEALATVLGTTQQAIRSWATEHRAAAEVWAGSPEMLRLTQELLATARTREALRRSPAQGEIRSWLLPVLQAKRYQGFFIIAPDDSSVASSRDSNLGTPNVLVRERKHELARLWRGESVITSPQISDVALSDSDASLRKDQPTMFVGAPVRDPTGAVIAALTFRLDPGQDFTAILQRGRIGASGETYAFDREGRLISESRFDDQLRSIGLLGAEDRGILNVELRDPGEKLLRAGASGRPRDQRPLTRMAESAIAGEAGIDLDGYRDYRGVPVIGAWLWDSDLKLGLTTEIDRDEAYATVNSTRTIIFALSGLAMCLMIGLAFFVAVWRRLSARLEDALTQVLSGFVPICAACKKIRDERDEWTAVERYVATRTAAQFTHSICPECETALYGERD
jgi:hypothetical protein